MTAEEVIKLLTKGRVRPEDWQRDNTEKFIELSDLEKDAKLVPRYLFDPAAHTFAHTIPKPG